MSPEEFLADIPFLARHLTRLGSEEFTMTEEEIKTAMFKELEKDEYGLYIHTSNYGECRQAIDCSRMTLEQIKQQAEAKWGIVKGDCRLTKAAKRQAKKAMIEKLMKLYNVKESVN